MSKPQRPEIGPSILKGIKGKVTRLRDFIDTNALAPNEKISKPNITREQLGTYYLYHTHPDFRRQVRVLGHNIVVAGEAFGRGSSRKIALVVDADIKEKPPHDYSQTVGCSCSSAAPPDSSFSRACTSVDECRGPH
jgi:hypothetical protein